MRLKLECNFVVNCDDDDDDVIGSSGGWKWIIVGLGFILLKFWVLGFCFVWNFIGIYLCYIWVFV